MLMVVLVTTFMRAEYLLSSFSTPLCDGIPTGWAVADHFDSLEQPACFARAKVSQVVRTVNHIGHEIRQ